MSYTLHNKYEIYNDCVYIKWFEDGSKQQIDEPHIVSKSFCLLRGIPDEFYHVEIDNMIEVKGKTLLEENEYQVDYTYGLIRFNQCMDDKLVVVKEYYSRGNYYFPANRVYYKINPIDGTVVTMHDILDKIQEELRFEQKNAKEITEILKETINNAKIIDKNLKDSIELAKKLILELGIDQYVKRHETGNEDGRIPLNNGKLNVNLDADMLDGKHGSEYADKIHNHLWKDITDRPNKLPADGGNADTLDGKHAEELANKEHTHLKKDITDLIISKVGENNNYNDLDNKPTKLPADGGNADTIGNRNDKKFVWNESQEGNVLKTKFDTSINAIKNYNNNVDTSIHVEKALFAETCANADSIGGIFAKDIAIQSKSLVDVYVDVNKGNDKSDGSRDKPLKTIQKAFDIIPVISKHDITIHLSPGIYHENIDVGGYVSGKSIKITSDTNDSSKVIIKGVFKVNYTNGYFKLESLKFDPDANLVNSYILKDYENKTLLSLVHFTGSNFPVVENCELTAANISVDYLNMVYFNLGTVGRVKNTKIRSAYARIRGTGVMSDNGSDVFCWNCDVNQTTICYYSQAASIKVHKPIIPSENVKDYKQLKVEDIVGV